MNDCEINREKSINTAAEEFIYKVRNRRISEVDRRAKYLVIKLDTGDHLLLHLMLGGWLYWGDDDDHPDRTHQIILSFGREKLFFIGLRLGYLHLLQESEIAEKWAEMGPEPLSPAFSQSQLQALINGRHGALKTTLVNQQVISGIGNRYSDEICFEARLRPDRKCSAISGQEQSVLYTAVRTVLSNAVRCGGYMERPVYRGDDVTGGYGSRFQVYNREAKNCNRCGTLIVKDEISSKKTFYCPRCQM